MIVQRDAADGEERRGDPLRNLTDQVQADRFGTGFRRGRENRADADVVGAVAFGGQRLFQRMGAEADDSQAGQPLAALRARDRRPVFLAEMNAVGTDLERGVDVVVDDDGYVGARKRRCSTAMPSSTRWACVISFARTWIMSTPPSIMARVRSAGSRSPRYAVSMNP